MEIFNLFFEGPEGRQFLNSSGDNDRLQDEADRINSNLAERGIPSWVASAWVA